MNNQSLELQPNFVSRVYRELFYFFAAQIIAVSYGIFQQNYTLFLVFLIFHFFSHFLLKMVSSNAGRPANSALSIDFNLIVLIYLVIAILVDFERTALWESTQSALPWVGNENTFFQFSQEMADNLNNGLSLSDILFIQHLDDPSYSLLTVVLQYTSFHLDGNYLIFLNIIPNIFLASCSAYLLLDLYDRKGEMKNGNALRLILIAFFPLLLMYGTVGLRDIIVVFFTILAYHQLIYGKPVIKYFWIALSLIITYYTRNLSLLLLLQLLVGYKILTHYKNKPRVLVALTVLAIGGFFVVKGLVLSYFSSVFSNDLSALIENYAMKSVLKADENSLAIRLSNIGIPGISFLVYFLDPFFVLIYRPTGFFSSLIGLSGFLWNGVLFVLIFGAIRIRDFRLKLLQSPLLLISVILMLEIFGLSREIRHKLPFLLLFIMEGLRLLSQMKDKILIKKLMEGYTILVVALSLIYYVVR